MTRGLEARAREEGFDVVAVSPAVTPARDAVALSTWLRRGHHASMHWMARTAAERRDPRLLLPGCRSVVTVAMNYFPGAQPDLLPGHGRVAAYARGRDYHKILGGRLRRLAGWLEQRTGQAARAFVDTGPVLERAWAERGGLGWIGKNSCLLHRELGSWLLLGEILTAAELLADPGPHEDLCGSCTACIDACPTDAIVAEGVVDSRACISYWTIEHRGPIPEQHRAGLADWIFGCDICQDVCPWNRKFARPVPPERFGRRDDLDGLDPVEVLESDESAFRARYSGTALMRAKWEGMRRNACVVLGNHGDPAALPALARALDDADAVVRSHAEWAIRAIGGRAAEQILRSRGGLVQ